MYRILVLLALSLVNSGLMAENLLSIYQLGLQHDAELKIARSVFEAEIESLPIANSARRPQIGFSLTGAYSDSEQPPGSIIGRNSSTIYGYSFGLLQNLYNAEILANVDAAEADLARAEANFAVSQQDLIVRVAERYFAILAAQDNLEFTQAEQTAIARQLDEAQKRFEVGLIAITDVKEAQAQFDRATAESLLAENLLANSYQALLVIIAEPPSGELARVGRYHGILSEMQTLNINPSVAYQINDRVSIGGGLDIMYGTVDLSSAVDFGAVCLAAELSTPPSLPPGSCAGTGATPQGLDGLADLTGDNTDNISTGFNLGITIETGQSTTLGLAYRSEVEMKVKGTANFTVPTSSAALNAVVTGSGAFVDTGISSTVDLPASFSFSASHRVSKFTLLADVTWTGWSSFQELRIVYDNPSQPDSVTTENWNDTYRFSLGFDYQQSDNMVLRAGMALDESPVPDAEHRTVRLPGNDRTWLSLGLTYLFSQDMSMDVGYSHLFVDDAPINNTLESAIPTLNSTVTGSYEASVDILSAQFNWNFN